MNRHENQLTPESWAAMNDVIIKYLPSVSHQVVSNEIVDALGALGFEITKPSDDERKAN